MKKILLMVLALFISMGTMAQETKTKKATTKKATTEKVEKAKKETKEKADKKAKFFPVAKWNFFGSVFILSVFKTYCFKSSTSFGLGKTIKIGTAHV